MGNSNGTPRQVFDECAGGKDALDFFEVRDAIAALGHEPDDALIETWIATHGRLGDGTLGFEPFLALVSEVSGIPVEQLALDLDDAGGGGSRVRRDARRRRRRPAAARPARCRPERRPGSS